MFTIFSNSLKNLQDNRHSAVRSFLSAAGFQFDKPVKTRSGFGGLAYSLSSHLASRGVYTIRGSLYSLREEAGITNRDIVNMFLTGINPVLGFLSYAMRHQMSGFDKVAYSIEENTHTIGSKLDEIRRSIEEGAIPKLLRKASFLLNYGFTGLRYLIKGHQFFKEITSGYREQVTGKPTPSFMEAVTGKKLSLLQRAAIFAGGKFIGSKLPDYLKGPLASEIIEGILLSVTNKKYYEKAEKTFKEKGVFEGIVSFISDNIKMVTDEVLKKRSFITRWGFRLVRDFVDKGEKEGNLKERMKVFARILSSEYRMLEYELARGVVKRMYYWLGVRFPILYTILESGRALTKYYIVPSLKRLTGGEAIYSFTKSIAKYFEDTFNKVKERIFSNKFLSEKIKQVEKLLEPIMKKIGNFLKGFEKASSFLANKFGGIFKTVKEFLFGTKEDPVEKALNDIGSTLNSSQGIFQSIYQKIKEFGSWAKDFFKTFADFKALPVILKRKTKEEVQKTEETLKEKLDKIANNLTSKSLEENLDKIEKEAKSINETIREKLDKVHNKFSSTEEVLKESVDEKLKKLSDNTNLANGLIEEGIKNLEEKLEKTNTILSDSINEKLEKVKKGIDVSNKLLEEAKEEIKTQGKEEKLAKIENLKGILSKFFGGKFKMPKGLSGLPLLGGGGASLLGLGRLPMLGLGGGALLKGGALLLGAFGLFDLIKSFFEGKPSENKFLGTLGDAAKGAVAGAAIGSVVPGVGTLTGAAVGGVAGLTMGAIRNYKDSFMSLFGNKSPADLEKEKAKLREVVRPINNSQIPYYYGEYYSKMGTVTRGDVVKESLATMEKFKHDLKLDPDLISLYLGKFHVESGFNPFARTGIGGGTASGLGQLIDSTRRKLLLETARRFGINVSHCKGDIACMTQAILKEGHRTGITNPIQLETYLAVLHNVDKHDFLKNLSPEDKWLYLRLYHAHPATADIIFKAYKTDKKMRVIDVLRASNINESTAYKYASELAVNVRGGAPNTVTVEQVVDAFGAKTSSFKQMGYIANMLMEASSTPQVAPISKTPNLMENINVEKELTQTTIKSPPTLNAPTDTTSKNTSKIEAPKETSKVENKVSSAVNSGNVNVFVFNVTNLGEQNRRTIGIDEFTLRG